MTEPDLGPVFVSAEWLIEHRDRPDVVLVDIRWYLDGRSGQAAYEAGHVPGAIYVELNTALAAPPTRELGRHPLPEESRFAEALGAAGIGDDVTVVAYDDVGGTVAGRLVWLLRRIGQGAALLDGGLAAWPGELETAPTLLPAVTRSPRRWPAGLIVDADTAAAAPVLIDARAAERYRGEVEPIDSRAGHIPGARSVPFGANLQADGHFRPPEDLRRVFAEVGVGPASDPPVVYCGSGVTACQVLLAMEAADLGVGRLYAGSWSQWSGDPERPVATGSSDLPGDAHA